MAITKEKLRYSDNYKSIWCPGCKEPHPLNDKWGWNGSYDKPTFTPSLLVTNGHYAPHYNQGDPCWCTWNAENPDNPSGFQCERCHSFITDGKIQFLSDCTHDLVNQTVDLPNYPESE